MYDMYTKPWEHQLRALDYLMVRHYGALYTDMGSGKTKVGIDLIVNRQFTITLIVGTKKSCSVWVKEFSKHCNMQKQKIYVKNLSEYSTAEKLSILKESLRKLAISHQKIVFIINYDSIWRKPFSEQLLKVPIDCVICDESHRIKTPSSKCSMYLTRVGKRVPNRFLMTGTPTTNSPLDVYAQYRFLQPEIFGTNYSKFRDEYENVDLSRTMFAGYRVLNRKQPYKNLDKLKKKMYSCAFYVTPNLHLPEQTFIEHNFTPTQQLIDIYKQVSLTGVYETQDGVMEINNALVKILRLQQLLSGYTKLEDLNFTDSFEQCVDTSRIEALEEILEGIPENESIVVFCKFRYDFESIKNLCQKMKIPYGEISGMRDDEKQWQDGKSRLLAVHYQSGSESIDLTKARYCIYYSLSHSYGLYQQSLKRVHRPGQKRPVTYYSLVGVIPQTVTIDQQIQKALSMKKDIATYLLEIKQAHL